eukprot:Ihof_evm3s77 gene=Ihof_evmTU3s77
MEKEREKKKEGETEVEMESESVRNKEMLGREMMADIEQGEGKGRYGVKVVNAFRCMARGLLSEYHEIGDNALIALESIFNVDSVVSWIPFIQRDHILDTTRYPVESLAFLMVDLVTLRMGPG